MTAAAFSATYSDWKVIKGRKVVQIVFELPLEKSDEAYQVLGGMPIAATEKWCAIARLNPNKEVMPPESQHDQPPETQPRPVTDRQASPAGADKRKFEDMPAPQQAGMLSQDRAFRFFLAEKFEMPIPDPDEAASIIRHHCKVKSRAHLTPDNAEWSSLVLAYRLWQRHPELSPA